MKTVTTLTFVLTLLWLAGPVLAAGGYEVVGSSGVMYFVAVDGAQKDNEDVYRFAVAEICGGKRICQVQFWVGSAPDSFPLNDDEIESKLVQWQQNQNTGLRRWLVRCEASALFTSGRRCM